MATRLEQDEADGPYLELWGDTVVLRDLTISLVIVLVLTMGGFLLVPGDEPRPLIAGLVGAAIGFIVCTLAFRPKRAVHEHRGDDTEREESR